jgi:hypothetical protein
MIHGFDLTSPLVCEGIVGDGCGGGRLFMVEDEILKAYDPVTKESFILLQNIYNALSISKSTCIITVVCQNEEIKFDLSALKKV